MLFHPMPTLRSTLAVLVGCACFAAHANDGAPDPTFGSGGMVQAGLEGTNFKAVVARPDGRVVACGSWQPNPVEYTQIVVAQFLADGTPDTGFGIGGQRLIAATSDREECTGIALQADGRVVVAGYATGGFPPGSNLTRIVARLTTDGALDPAFAAGAGHETFAGGLTTALALQNDGKILLGGYGPDASSYVFQVKRLLADGSPDTDFGSSSLASAGFAGGSTFDFGLAVAVDGSGRVIVAGTSDYYGDYRMAVARFLGNGQPDANFGDGGKVRGPAGTRGLAMAMQRDGALVVVGTADPPPELDAAAMRVLDDGSIDDTFGDAGVARLRWIDGSDVWTTWGAAVAIQDDGRIVIAGFTENTNTLTLGFLGRLDTHGQPDSAFANNGVETIDFANMAQPMQALNGVTLSSGRVVAVGDTSEVNGNRTGALARFENDLIFANGF